MDEKDLTNQTSFKNQEFTDVKSQSKKIDPRQSFNKDQIECGAESQVQISSENQELIVVKVEKILKDSLDSILSPSPSVKIQIMGGSP